ncbi:heterokaryon incompatibility protein-domain-containing protein [Hypoxylon sp. NC0597]|nr:heterokaryon incompatibility protein-domain-containing protein [Hypoxylon sp. NC0597]
MAPEDPYTKTYSWGYFRLILLRAGEWDSPLRCDLTWRRLEDGPEYQALSYAWGSPHVTRPILVNEVEMKVTVNLETALRRLRRKHSDVVLWCINQKDFDERRDQVQRMRQIYSQAAAVVVFLGDGKTHSTSSRLGGTEPQEFIFHGGSRDEHHINQFLSHCRANSMNELPAEFGTFCLISFLGQHEHELADTALSRTEAWQASVEDLRMMLLSRWWNRMWVFQEILVSENVLVRYGGSVAPWSMFAAAAYNTQASQYHDNLSPDAEKVLHAFSKCIIDVEDSRNRWLTNGRITHNNAVYALLGLVRPGLDITADYYTNTSDLYTRVARNIIRLTNSLDVLIGDLGRKNRSDLPSWVPDWSAFTYSDEVQRTKVIVKSYNACEGLKFSCWSSTKDLWEFIRESLRKHMANMERSDLQEPINMLVDFATTAPLYERLVIPAIYAGEIQVCSDQFPGLADIKTLWGLCINWSSSSWDFAVTNEGGKKPILGTSDLRALVFDLKFVAGQFERLNDGDDILRLCQWFEARTSQNNPAFRDTLGFDHVLNFMSTRRRLFMTSDGRLGWGPEGLRHGDQIFVLPGGRAPYVLRRHNRLITWQMVGDCYLHGSMDGQRIWGLTSNDWGDRIIKEDRLAYLEIIRGWLEKRRLPCERLCLNGQQVYAHVDEGTYTFLDKVRRLEREPKTDGISRLICLL